MGLQRVGHDRVTFTSLLQGIFLTWGLNLGLLYCRTDLQDLLELTLPKDVLFIIEDWNAKVGSQETPGSEVKSEVAQSCPTLCNPLDCGLSGSSVHGIFQARVLEWTAISFSKGSSQPRARTLVSRIVYRHFTI